MKRTYNILTCCAFAGSILFINSGKVFSQSVTGTIPRTVSLDPLLRPFYHGVASGDPLPDAVIIWTRVTPDTGSTGAITVDWRMATDTNMTQIVKNGTITTDATIDYTVKFDVTGLQPATYYYYEFTAFGKNSLIGRTKTAPASVADIDSLRFAFIACANYPYGYFNSYSAIKKGNDIDAVIHLGDYFYEYDDGYSTGTLPERPNEPAKELIELSDYRTRYSHYHLDPDLRKLHQQYPWLIIWDDHETANNSYRDGAENHDTATEGSWANRKSAGMRAWTEWLPVRKPNPSDSMQIFRKAVYGNLATIYLLDARLFDRDVQNLNLTNDTAHHLLGIAQRNWFYNELLNSAPQWNIVAQQVMMAPLSGGSILNSIQQLQDLKADMWEGYNAERQSLIDFVLNNNIKNVVVLTGDIHTSWANDIPTSFYVSAADSDTATGSAMVEFVTTSVTSPGLEAWLGATINSQLHTLVYPNNPHVKYVNLDEKGYNILDINKSRTQNDFYFVNTIIQPDDSSQAKEFRFVNNNERALRKATAKTSAGSWLTSVPFAPENPHNIIGIKETGQPTVILGTYPSPFSDYFVVQFYTEKSSQIRIKMMDITGKIISDEQPGTVSVGLHIYGIETQGIANGIYFLLIETANGTVKQKLVKGK